MEIPQLTSSTILFLNDKVSIVDVVNVSSFTKSRHDMEISINFETELFIHLSLSWFSLPVFDIDEIPLLMFLSILLVHEDVPVFYVLCI
jgi:hypothetical protein